jgi:hypothetical protein
MRFFYTLIFCGLGIVTTITAADTPVATPGVSPAVTPTAAKTMDPDAPIRDQIYSPYLDGGMPAVFPLIQQWLRKDADGYYRMSQFVQLGIFPFTDEQCITLFGTPDPMGYNSKTIYIDALVWAPKRTETRPLQGPSLIRDDRTFVDKEYDSSLPLIPGKIYRIYAVKEELPDGQKFRRVSALNE